MRKPILCLDFDGVIHSYASGWKGATVIPDPPVGGALEFIAEAVNHFEVHIFSSRSLQPGGIDAMRMWLHQWLVTYFGSDGHEIIKQIKWPTEKPPAHVTLDDRALTFNGNWPSMDELKNFKPWYKR